MSKTTVLALSMLIITNSLFGQLNYKLEGSVFGENQEPLTGAVVLLSPTSKAVTTNGVGNFKVENVPQGKYQIQISFIGYNKLIDSVIIDRTKTYNANLQLSVLSLQEVLVTDDYAEARKKEESLNIEIVNDDYLKQNMGGSLMNSLERLPGVSTIDIGSGQSKPVIRGLGFNRVVVVENNIKHEAQQWGTDHGLEIDQYSVDNIEVIKGPASLMYGSDAIGGVIDMKNRKVPAENSFGGVVDLTGKTNNDFVGTSVSVYGRKSSYFAKFRATILDYGDYKVPTDSVDIYSYRAPLHNNHLRNTAGKELNLHLTFGIIKERFQSSFFVSNVNSKNGFFANAHGLEPRNIDTELHDRSNRDILYPYQKVQHYKIINTSSYSWGKLRMESNIGVQRNFRQEWSTYTSHGDMPPVFPDTLDFPSDLEREFDKNVMSGNVKFMYYINSQLKLNFGVSGEHQQNEIDGRGFIIPAYNQSNGGIYALGKYSFSPASAIQLGVRYDYGVINTQEYYDWYPSEVVEGEDTTYQYLQRAYSLNRSFSNVSWSLGYNYNLPNWMFKANIGKGFRMPTAKELAANGVNYHRFSYDVGNPDLSPEISWQFDMGVEYSAPNFAIGTTPFLNYFSNYIYLNPSSEHDRLYGNGNQIYYYTESKVFRYGFELHTHYDILNSLQLGIIGEYVYSEQLSGKKEGYTLPFSPQPSAVFNIKYYKQTVFKFIENGYLSLGYKLTAAQYNVVPPEEPTDGYQLVNIGMGGTVRFNNQVINITAQVQNLFNAKYFSHTSYYRLINVPESGRNFIVNLSIPFGKN